MKLAFAFLAAIVLPACLLGVSYLYGQFTMFSPADPYVWVRTSGFLLLCFVISAAYVFVLGIPAYVLLRWRNAVRWWSIIGTGFVLGAIPPAILAWPLRYSSLHTSASFDGVQTMVNGNPTMAGWLQYFEGLSFMGACGAVGALAFWVVSRK